MKKQKHQIYIILFVAFTLIFGFVLACGEVSTKPEKVEELTEEEMIIEEDIEADIEEDIEEDIEKKYMSRIMMITLLSASSLEKIGQASSDVAEHKISMSEHKAISKKYIKEINDIYNIHLELKPSKRLEISNDLFDKAMDHLLKSAIFLQSYIDTEDIEEMTEYLGLSINELNLYNEYLSKATEQINKLTE